MPRPLPVDFDVFNDTMKFLERQLHLCRSLFLFVQGGQDHFLMEEMALIQNVSISNPLVGNSGSEKLTFKVIAISFIKKWSWPPCTYNVSILIIAK